MAEQTAIVLNLSVFDTTNVHVWFAQLEAIFQAKKIHSQMARYAYVVEKLPPEIVSDVLDSVPTHDPFDTLKEAIENWKITGASIKWIIQHITVGRQQTNTTTAQSEEFTWETYHVRLIIP